MFKKHTSRAPQLLLDDAGIMLLSDNDMDKILGGFHEPEHHVMPNNPYPWEPSDTWTDPLLD
ncbi:hypothetical protein [Hymenobacter rubripertinctus]|uniref:Uncharacterized protein n=1 Tax=Hymenobacter rubripertinctus TaxID=2029981 RepID=A0A418QNA9_9BACT|nr:hypothetical protein [Hymenobacter rubripertinctus]RIY06683.1 hypothetical protein D0T11_18200 [Hymenobacter rubripertinctus]